jgi:RNA polymerase sigma-70 factor (ECF subfamily)
MVGPNVAVQSGLGTSERIEALFASNEHRLGQFLVQMVRDRALAEDLLQETFLDAFRASSRLDGVASPDAWLFGIARHRALASLRRTRRMQRAVEGLWQRTVDRGETSSQVEVMDVLGRALGADDRALVLLRYVHDVDAATLAELTGRSPAAIRKRLQRACAALAKEMNPGEQ